MAPHSSSLAWKIPWTEEPGRPQSMGSWRVGHDWATSLTFHFHALEKEMATCSSVLAWKIPGTVEPDGLPSMGSHRVGHDWTDLVAAAAADILTHDVWIPLFSSIGTQALYSIAFLSLESTQDHVGFVRCLQVGLSSLKSSMWSSLVYCKTEVVSQAKSVRL